MYFSAKQGIFYSFIFFKCTEEHRTVAEACTAVLSLPS